MEQAYIVSGVRTAIGKFGGALRDIEAVDLGAIVVREALLRAGLEGAQVDEVIIGNVFQAGNKGNPARQAAIIAGMPVEVPAMTINKQCASGLRALSIASGLIKGEDLGVAVVGGLESMTRVPYLLKGARWGYRAGNALMEDSLLYDGLVCAMENYHMGVTAENLAEKFGISREEQDEFAYGSQQKAKQAIERGRFKDEMVPVPILQKKGGPLLFQIDEQPNFNASLESLAQLKPVFKSGGTVTAGNASGLNDGAAALVLVSESKLKELRLKPMARVVATAQAGVEPSIMGFGPVPAVKQALKKAGMTLNDLDLIESNEAFAVQALAVQKTLGFDPAKVNVNGGAVALGHPVGATGARLVVTLMYELQKQGLKRGLATLCIGGGMGAAAIIEMC
ncbi:MAG: thiolase family protein [Desulfitobacteriaceae bacterium]